jgi:hypothetical protein
MSDQATADQRRDKLLLRLMKAPPQTRDRLKADRARAKAAARAKSAGAQKRPANG